MKGTEFSRNSPKEKQFLQILKNKSEKKRNNLVSLKTNTIVVLSTHRILNKTINRVKEMKLGVPCWPFRYDDV